MMLSLFSSFGDNIRERRLLFNEVPKNQPPPAEVKEQATEKKDQAEKPKENPVEGAKMRIEQAKDDVAKKEKRMESADAVSLKAKLSQEFGGEVIDDLAEDEMTALDEASKTFLGKGYEDILRKNPDIFSDNPEEALAKVPEEQKEKVKEVLASLSPDQKSVCRKVLQKISEGIVEKGKGEERRLTIAEKSQVETACRSLLANYDDAKATEFQRGMMQARLRMAGADADQTNLKTKQVVAFEGTKIQRAINQFIGILSYIFGHLQNIKDEVEKAKNAGKKKEEAPAAVAAKPGEGPARNEEVKNSLKEQMKAKSGDVLKTEKTQRLDELKKVISEKDKQIIDLNKNDNDEDRRAVEHFLEELTPLKAEEARLEQEITVLTEMKALAETQKITLKSAVDFLLSNLKAGTGIRITNHEKIQAALEKIQFTVDEKFQITLIAPGNVRTDINGDLNVRLNAIADHLAIDDNGVLKDPAAVIAVFQRMRASFLEEINKPPPNPGVVPNPGAA